LAALDQLMARSRSEKAFTAALEAQFRADPVKFFKTIVIPLMPRAARRLAGAGQLASLRSFVLGMVLRKEVQP
jgi:hypothetical protein